MAKHWWPHSHLAHFQLCAWFAGFVEIRQAAPLAWGPNRYTATQEDMSWDTSRLQSHRLALKFRLLNPSITSAKWDIWDWPTSALRDQHHPMWMKHRKAKMDHGEEEKLVYLRTTANQGGHRSVRRNSSMGTSLLAVAYQDCYWFKKIQFRYEEIYQVLVICPEAETLNTDNGTLLHTPVCHSMVSPCVTYRCRRGTSEVSQLCF